MESNVPPNWLKTLQNSFELEFSLNLQQNFEQFKVVLSFVGLTMAEIIFFVLNFSFLTKIAISSFAASSESHKKMVALITIRSLLSNHIAYAIENQCDQKKIAKCL